MEHEEIYYGKKSVNECWKVFSLFLLIKKNYTPCYELNQSIHDEGREMAFVTQLEFEIDFYFRFFLSFVFFCIPKLMIIWFELLFYDKNSFITFFVQIKI